MAKTLEEVRRRWQRETRNLPVEMDLACPTCEVPAFERCVYVDRYDSKYGNLLPRKHGHLVFHSSRIKEQSKFECRYVHAKAAQEKLGHWLTEFGDIFK